VGRSKVNGATKWLDLGALNRSPAGQLHREATRASPITVAVVEEW
jgi:hypothetical protein